MLHVLMVMAHGVRMRKWTGPRPYKRTNNGRRVSAQCAVWKCAHIHSKHLTLSLTLTESTVRRGVGG